MTVNRAWRCLVPLAFGLLFAAPMALAAEPTGTFATISDIHFDPLDPPEFAQRLADTAPQDWDEIFAEIESQTASPYGKDSNYALLKSAMQAFSRAAADVDFVVVPGDFLAHRIEERAADALGVDRNSPAVAALTEKTTVYLANALRDALPGKPMILALGNNDSACGDYKIQPGGPYLAATAKAIRDTLGDDALDPDFDETYGAGGYYAVRHPTVKTVVVIVLNDTLWSAKYDDDCADGTPANEAADMLAWLERRLETARSDGESVWLVRHIPAGLDAFATDRSKAKACDLKAVPLLREPYASAMPDLMRRYARTITASLAGHLHHDAYRIVADKDGTVAGFDKIAPAISPIFGQNPGFQIFSYDPATGVPTDFETWYLADLESTSLASPGDWRREYDFSGAYGQPDLSAASVATMWTAAQNPGATRQQYARYYNVSHDELSEAELPAYLCAMRHSDVAGFNACYCDE
jgi:sphingomyelin phosphodiesterase acid-like 3